MKVVVRVTSKLLRAGVFCNPQCCPIALAISAWVKDDVCVLVGSSQVKLFWNGGELSRDLSDRARAFVGSYDTEPTSARPFAFQLDLPAELLR